MKLVFDNWISVANLFWMNGMPDKHALQRHKRVFELIAEHAVSQPSDVDFNETLFSLNFVSPDHPDRKIKFMFWRLHGKALLSSDLQDPAERPTRDAVGLAFGWLNEKKPKVRKARKKASGII